MAKLDDISTRITEPDSGRTITVLRASFEAGKYPGFVAEGTVPPDPETLEDVDATDHEQTADTATEQE